MSKKASNFQKKTMSLGYRGKEIFKPLNTGWIDDNVACVREWIANIFFYTKNGTTIMIDAGYNYDRLAEKMKWIDIDPGDINHILITHQDTDHVGAVERDSDGLFRDATLYLSEIENKYLTGETRRKVIFGAYKLPMVETDNPRVLLKDGEVFCIDDIKVEAILVPGHTWGHMVYLIDDAYLFTGDTIWFGADGGYSFINSLAEDNELAKRSLAELERKLRERGITPKVITGHTGWSDDLDFVFAHRDKVCNSFRKQKPHDPKAPYDGYDERDDTETKARSTRLTAATEVRMCDVAHEYYRRKAPKLKKAMNSLLKPIAGELEGVSGKGYKELFSDIWEHYENNMLEFFPYIGGDDVSGTGNLTGAYCFVSMGEVLKNYGVSMEEIGHMMVLAYERRFNGMPGIVKTIAHRSFTNVRSLNKKYRKKDAQNAANASRYPGSFETKTMIPPEEGYDFSYHNLVCPLSDFAKAHGYEEYMPYLCNLDYVMFGAFGVPLFREHTCFEDGDYCDFKLKIDAEPMDHWPPVFTQGKGYK